MQWFDLPDFEDDVEKYDFVQQIIDDFGHCRLMLYFVWRSFNDKTFIWVSYLNIT